MAEEIENSDPYVPRVCAHSKCVAPSIPILPPDIKQYSTHSLGNPSFTSSSLMCGLFYFGVLLRAFDFDIPCWIALYVVLYSSRGLG